MLASVDGVGVARRNERVVGGQTHARRIYKHRSRDAGSRDSVDMLHAITEFNA